MKPDFAKALTQLGAKDPEVLTAEGKESIVIEDRHQKFKKQLTVAEFWNINIS